MKPVNMELLKSIPHSNPTAETMFLIWNERRRARRSTTLKRFRKHLRHYHKVKLDDHQYEEVFARLAQAGVGSIDRDKSGHITRFEWNFGMQSVARAAIGDPNAKLETFAPVRDRIPKLTVAVSRPLGPKPRSLPRVTPIRSTSGKVTVYVVKENKTICLHLDEEEAKSFASLMTG